MEDDDIQNKITQLKNLNTELDEFATLLSTLVCSDDAKHAYEELMKTLEPMDRINLNWNLSYSVYTLYYSK
jgi:hypothetical protein